MKVIDDAEAPRVVSENAEKASCELERIYYGHKGRRIFKWHHYLRIYDRHMERYRAFVNGVKSDNFESVAVDGRLRILELGVQNGGSLQMWREYFGANAIIYGIDIDPRCKEFEESGCEIRIGSQDDPEFLNQVVDEMGGVDVVLDDGSHIASHQLASLKALFRRVNTGGLYIVEDLHTSYWDDWEGGLRRPGTFIEVVKDAIDHMHEWYVGVDTQLNHLEIKTLVTGLHVYDSVVVIEKATKTEPYAVHVGESSFGADAPPLAKDEDIATDAETSQVHEAINGLSAQSNSMGSAASWKVFLGKFLSAQAKKRIRKSLHVFGVRV